MSKPLAGAPVVVAQLGDQELPALPSGQRGTTYDYVLTVPEDAPEGSWRLVATLTDAALNRVEAEVPLPAPLAVDVSAPTPAWDDVVAVVVHHRQPWGTAADPEGRAFVEGPHGVLDPGLRLLGFSEGERRAPLAETAVAEDGSFRLDLPDEGPGRVLLAVTDDACNTAGDELEPVAVELGEWVAVPPRGTPDAAESPHTLEARPRHTPVLVQRGAARPAALGPEPLTTTGAGSWRLAVPATLMGGDDGPLLYDATRGRTLLFRGRGPDDSCRTHGEVAEWNGRRWSRRCVDDPGGDGGPVLDAAIAGTMAAVFDPVRDRVVLVESSSRWTWLSDGDTWSAVSPPDPEGDGNPGGLVEGVERYFVAAMELGMVFDPVAGRTLLLALEPTLLVDGCPEGFLSAEGVCERAAVWEWDGTSWRLASLEPMDGTHAPVLNVPGQGLFFDAERDELVLASTARMEYLREEEDRTGCGDDRWVGGARYHRDGSLQMWAWDGESWRRLPQEDPEGDGEPGSHLATWYGGGAGMLAGAGALWEWTGTSWRRLVSLPDPPLEAFRATSKIVWQGHDDSVLLVDFLWQQTDTPWARCGSGVLSDAEGACTYVHTWRWRGAEWELLRRDDARADGRPRDAAWTADDPRTGEVHTVQVLAADAEVLEEGSPRTCPDGNEPESLDCYATTVWSWDGYGWSRAVPTFGADWAVPGWGLVSGLVVAEALGGVLLLEAVGVDAEPDGRCRDGSPPEEWGDSAICPDFVVWRWSEGAWSRVAVEDPEGDGGPRSWTYGPQAGVPDLDLDRKTGRLWLVQATDDLEAELWSFDGRSWARQVPADPEGDGDPEGVLEAVFDTARDTIVALEVLQAWREEGGDCPEGTRDSADEGICEAVRLFEWTGGSWAVSKVEGEAKVAWADAAYDPQRERLLLHSSDGEMWELAGSRWRHLPTVDVEDDGNPKPPADGIRTYFGGAGAGGAPRLLAADSLWTWDHGTGGRPSHALHVRLAEAGLPPGTEVEAVGVAWTAGGRGWEDDGTRAGVALEVWDAGAWREVDASEAGTDAPAGLSWSSEDPRVLGRLFVGEEDVLGLLVAPVAPAGGRDEPGEVTTTTAEVRVRYRLPGQDW